MSDKHRKPRKRQKQTKRSVIELKLWAKRTTVEGMVNMVESDSLTGQVFWASVIVIFMCALLFHFTMLIRGYLASHVSSEMKIDINPVDFPDVTICGMKPVAESLLHYYNPAVAYHLETNWDFFDGWLKKNRTRKPGENLFDFLLRVKELFSMMMDIAWSSDNLNDLLFSDTVSILDCKFNGVKCFSNSFTLIQHPSYWNCYLFKPPLNLAKFSLIGDGEVGFSVDIFTDDNFFNVNYQNYAQFNASLFDQFYTEALSLKYLLNMPEQYFTLNNFMSKYEADGVKVIVHPSGTYPLYGEAEKYMSYIVQNGVSSTLRAESVERNRLNTTIFSCFSDLQEVNYLLSMNSSKLFTRTRFDLHAERAQNEVNRLCGCYSHRFPLQSRRTELCYYVPKQYWKEQSDKILRRIECHDKWYEGANDEINSGTRYLREPDAQCQRKYKDVQLDTTEWPNEEDVFLVVSEFFSEWLNAEVPSEYRKPNVLDFSDPKINASFGNKSQIRREMIAIMALLDQACASKFSPETNFNNNLELTNAVSDCVNFTKVSKNLLRLNVRIATLGAIIYSEKPTYDIWEILSEIGGVIGLWFGISVMTLFEICELMLIITLSREQPQSKKEPPNKKLSQENQESLEQMDEQSQQYHLSNMVGYTVGQPLSKLSVELSSKRKDKIVVPVTVIESQDADAKDMTV